MARGVNKVILVGNLGRDPEVRYMPSGNAVANVTLATTDSWKEREARRSAGLVEKVDEGTAMFKMAPTVAELPVEGPFVSLDIDGEAPGVAPASFHVRSGALRVHGVRREFLCQ